MADRFVLYLIRHLPTAGNEQRRYIGWTDEPILESTELRPCLSPATLCLRQRFAACETKCRVLFSGGDVCSGSVVGANVILVSLKEKPMRTLKRIRTTGDGSMTQK